MEVFKPYVLEIHDRELIDFFEKLEDVETFLKPIVRAIMRHVQTNTAETTISECIENAVEKMSQKIFINMHGFEERVSDKLKLSRLEYLDDMKQVLSSNGIAQMGQLPEKMEGMLEKISNSLIVKTSNVLKELIPTENSLLSREIASSLEALKGALYVEISKISSSSLTTKSITDYLVNINNILSVNERQWMNKLEDINVSQKALGDRVGAVVQRFENSSTKGFDSEMVVYNLLVDMYHEASIRHVGNDSKTGDILFQRKMDTPRILIENKEYSRNVPSDEVEKFIRDCNEQNCCGIMMSQRKGISYRNDFELQINGRNVLLYLHAVNFDGQKIATAVRVVEEIKGALDSVYSESDENGETRFIISDDVLAEINSEYAAFMCNIQAMMKMSKDYYEKMVEQLRQIHLPSLHSYLKDKFAKSGSLSPNATNEVSVKSIQCEHCGVLVKKSLKGHLRHCKGKKDLLEKSD